jgi:hypothetical protein
MTVSYATNRGCTHVFFPLVIASSETLGDLSRFSTLRPALSLAEQLEQLATHCTQLEVQSQTLRQLQMCLPNTSMLQSFGDNVRRLEQVPVLRTGSVVPRLSSGSVQSVQSLNSFRTHKRSKSDTFRLGNVNVSPKVPIR